MTYRTRIFIDFWNFQLHWNDRSGRRKCDWTLLPAVLMQEAAKLLSGVSTTAAMDLEETLVYASYNPRTEANLKRWLDNFLNKQPSFRVTTLERRTVKDPVRCGSCGSEISECANCGAEYTRTREKGVDTAIITDLLSLAWQGAFDVAILLSSDADHVPAVERVQEKGLKVINATWTNHGYDLAKTSWASFWLDGVIEQLCRTEPGP